jgi:ureidoacrylate peracid hydrolase
MNNDTEDLLVTLDQKAAPGHAALVVVDVQNDFVADGGYFSRLGIDVKPIQRSVPPLQRLIERAREAGVLVIFIQAIYDPQYVSAPMRERDLRSKRIIPRCLTGSWGAQFYGVEPRAGEPVVIKHRYSAVPNTALVPLLKQRGIRSLLFTGVATDTCVESTARDAYFIDYYVTLVEDCCAASSDSDHAGALARFSRDYGPVVTSNEVIAAWERSAVPAAHLAAGR